MADFVTWLRPEAIKEKASLYCSISNSIFLLHIGTLYPHDNVLRTSNLFIGFFFIFSVVTLMNNYIKFTSPSHYFTPNIGDKRSDAKVLPRLHYASSED